MSNREISDGRIHATQTTARNKTGNGVSLCNRRRTIRLIALGKHNSETRRPNGKQLTRTPLRLAVAQTLRTPPGAGWPLRSRLRRAVSRSDGWSVLRWGEFRTGSVRDALGARDLQKNDLASSGQSELTSCERRACLLPWQLMPITAWTNQTHPSTWTRWRASGGFVRSVFTCRHVFEEMMKEKLTKEENVCRQRFF